MLSLIVLGKILSFLASGGSGNPWHSLACNYITPVSTPVFTCLLLCMCLSAFSQPSLLTIFPDCSVFTLEVRKRQMMGQPIGSLCLCGLADRVDMWYIWLENSLLGTVADLGIDTSPQAQQQYRSWVSLMGVHFLVAVVFFSLTYGWISLCSWAASHAREPHSRRKRRSQAPPRREEEEEEAAPAPSATALKKRKIYCRELIPAPPMCNAYNRAVLKSLRIEEEKRTGKKLPTFRDAFTERHPCGKPVPANFVSYTAVPDFPLDPYEGVPTGDGTSNPSMYRKALRHKYEELETFYIWIRPNGRVAEVSDMQCTRYVGTEEALEIEKKSEELKKSMLDAKTVQQGLCHDRKEVERGSFKQRKRDKV